VRLPVGGAVPVLVVVRLVLVGDRTRRDRAEAAFEASADRPV
jgi:hypothetical protein